jgi:flagellar hook-length control protein FliK
MSTPSIDNSIRTTKADLLQVGLSGTAAATRKEESFDAHLKRDERVARTQEKPARKNRREEPTDEAPSRHTPTPPPAPDAKAPVQNPDDNRPSSDQSDSPDASAPNSSESETPESLEQQPTLAGTAPSDVPVQFVEVISLATDSSAELIQTELQVSAEPVAKPELTSSSTRVVPSGIETTELVTATELTSQVAAVEGEQIIDVVTEGVAIPVEANATADQSAVDQSAVSPTTQVTGNRATVKPTHSPVRDDIDERARGADRSQETGSANLTGTLDAAVAAMADQNAESAAIQESAKDESADGSSNPISSSSAINNADATGASSPTRLASHILARGNERTAKESRLNEADQARLLDRVARAVKTAENRQGVVRLRLHPPELGSVRIELRMQQGVMTARLEAETTTARTLLVENVQELRQRLSEQGVRVESFDVDTMDQRSPGDSRSPEQRRERDDAQRPARPEPEPDRVSVSERVITPPTRDGTPGKLNVIV